MTLDISGSLIADSTQLCAADLVAGPITVQIVNVTEYKDAKQPYAVHIAGRKPWIPCKGMRRLLAEVWTADAGTWLGRWVRLYREPTATFGSDPQGGIRVSGLSHIDKSFTANVPDSVTTAEGKKKKTMAYRVEKITPPASGMTLADFKGWLTNAVKREANPWPREAVATLLGCPADDVPPERRAEIVATLKALPPEPTPE